jgi:alpha-tubulin suppressor-like RCC1 family protein
MVVRRSMLRRYDKRRINHGTDVLQTQRVRRPRFAAAVSISVTALVAATGLVFAPAARTGPRVPRGASGDVTAVAIAAGDYHTCALTSVGGVKCWGWNGSGQLGNGTASGEMSSGPPSPVPVDVSGLPSGVSAITTGAVHTCALTNAGGVKCWGQNDGPFGQGGQLGDGTTTNRSTPVDVSGLASGVSTITAGGHHTCALTSGGFRCWGFNLHGQLGDGTTTERLTPVPVSVLSGGVSELAPAGHDTCALMSGGGVKCWGANYEGQLGNGTMSGLLDPNPIPVDVSGLASGVSTIAANGHHEGGDFNCVLTSGGGVKCWGSNFAGQLGDGTTTNRFTPVDVSGLASGIQSIADGGYHVCALTTAGGVKCWGDNEAGQLGDGTTTNRSSPIDVSGLSSGVKALAAGSFHTCALMTGGEVKCWGRNSFGQLGEGTTTQRLTPVTVLWAAPPPPPPPPPPPAAKCVVPNVKSKTLVAAKAAISAGHCSTGSVGRAYSRSVKKGRVISQKPAPGASLPSGSKVNLVVSRGRKR